MTASTGGEFSFETSGIRSVWGKLDTLLPPDYAVQFKNGHVRRTLEQDFIYVDLRAARRRGGFILNLLQDALLQKESVRVKERSMGIGRMSDTAMYALKQGKYDPYKLTVTDRAYTPVDPLNGDISSVQNMTGKFLLVASFDAEWNTRVTGIQFSLAMEEFIDGTLSEPFATVAPYSFSSASSSPGTGFAEYIAGEYLTEHGMPALQRNMSLDQKAEIINLCIDQALASD